MIGQAKLIAQIDDLIAKDKFPRFSIVVGERGMEHEDVAHYLAEKMQADYIKLQDVKVDTIREMIKQVYSLHHLTVYCIPHADDMSVNAKNALLKVVEEVPNKAYFVMCLEDLSNTLATIQSRGEVFRMSRPSSTEIKDFARSLYVNKSDIKENDIRLYGEICSSVGDVLMLNQYGVKNFYTYAEYVVDNMTIMSGAEVFKLSDKLSVKDGDEKWDCRLFLRCLQSVLMDRVSRVENKDNPEDRKKYFVFRCRTCNVIGAYMKDLRIKGINRQMLLDNMWLEVRKEWKSLM